MTESSRLIFMIIYLIIGFVMLAFMYNLLLPLDTARTFSRSMSLQIASAVDSMMAGPVGMEKNFSMPNFECSIVFTGTSVNITTKGSTYESPILIPEYGFEIRQKQPLLCDTAKKRVLYLKKSGNYSIDADIVDVGINLVPAVGG